MRVIKAKIKGKPADLVSEEPARDAKVVDLMERLRKSLASRGRGRARRGGVRPARVLAPAQRNDVARERRG
jgi:non-homologous end joining protein Ku